MEFEKGQIVEIIRVDPGEDPRWIGMRCEVGQIYLKEIQIEPTLLTQTKCFPLSDRPDTRFPYIEPRGWFYWATEDLRLVEEDGQRDTEDQATS